MRYRAKSTVVRAEPAARIASHAASAALSQAVSEDVAVVAHEPVLSEQTRDRALKLSVLDGMLHALMLGLSESYFGACAVALGHSDVALALLMSFPLFAGAVAQAFTGPLLLALGSRKRLVLVSACVQALSHIGLFCVAWFGVTELWPLLSLVTLYFVAGMVGVPAWGAWMGSLTESIDRPRYFGMRSALISCALLVSFVCGGYHLQHADRVGQLSHAYAMLFALGFVARVLSCTMLYLQPDPSRPPRDSWKRVLARTRSSLRSDGMQLGMGFALLMFGAHASVPFYAPYMLKELQLGYGGFAMLCAVQIVAKSLAFPFFHRVAALIGLPRLLLIANVLIVSVAWMWGAWTSMPLLVLSQLISGVAWASYDFASFQLLLRDSKPAQRVELLAMVASVGGLFQLCGALFGSFLLRYVHLSYREVFVVSAALRALPLLLLVPLLLPEVRRPLAPLVAGLSRVRGGLGLGK
jgi:MFS family permease